VIPVRPFVSLPSLICRLGARLAPGTNVVKFFFCQVFDADE
jgi:hypothetical protein